MYLAALFAGFIAPYNPRQDFYDEGYLNAKPQAAGIRFFLRGSDYTLLPGIYTNVHLFGGRNAPVFLFGTDRMGRDLFSRVVYGSRISLSIGLAGICLSTVLALIIGGFSGYIGGRVDEITQRIIDLLNAVPSLPLWMALSAALPRGMSTAERYLLITIILSLYMWSGLARVVRGKILSLRGEDYVIAAVISGGTEWKIIRDHMLPTMTSYVIASVTLSIPAMILGETSLSFIGLGLQPPAISWGVLLKDAQQLVVVAQSPWLLIPCLFVVVAVLVFNFIGDGLRDAADPYK
jgi:peptide/nickel transport system permease protein